MSISKRYLFDPAAASERHRAAEAVISAYQHRISAKRKNRVSATPYWDSLWEGAIHSAAAELGVRHIRVNDSICFERQAERDQVKKRAEVLWQERHDQYAALSRQYVWERYMFRVVEGAVPAGSVGRVDLFVKRDETTGAVTATWDRVGGAAKAPIRVRRVGGMGAPVSDAFKEAFQAAKEADVPLCVIDGDNLFPKSQRQNLKG